MEFQLDYTVLRLLSISLILQGLQAKLKNINIKLFLIVHENIESLDIPMDDIVLVEIFYCTKKLKGHFPYVLL